MPFLRFLALAIQVHRTKLTDVTHHPVADLGGGGALGASAPPA